MNPPKKHMILKHPKTCAKIPGVVGEDVPSVQTLG